MPLQGTDPARMLATLQQLLAIPAGDLRTALIHACNALAGALHADKVDAFLYDESRDSLVALGSSTQPLSSQQKKLGLDVLPLSNGGRVVHVYRTNEVFRTGRLREDPEELRGVKEGLKIQSKLGIPLTIGARLRGMVMIAALAPDAFSAEDEGFARSAVHWVGVVAHRAELMEHIERNAVEQGRKAAADELVTVLAHDLRNYLAPISGRLYALRQLAEASGDPVRLEHLDAAQRAITRVSSLITDLLDVARLDRGLFGMEPAPIDFAILARDSAAALATPAHGIIVRSNEPMTVMADASRLRQCVDNLLANAMAHSPDEAAVNVLVSRVRHENASWAQLEVIDEGPGIAKEVQPRIFERFVSGRGHEGGLGLGLYIARRIATAHGGDLQVESDLGKGARFILRIPEHEEPGKP
jgi:two-component system, OmpR family, sensor kinase